MTPESIVAPENPVVAALPVPLSPVAAEERIASIDVLRGVALLGILTINIWVFALPGIALADPSAAGGWSGANKGAWIVCHLLCEQKMMSLFSMLFGAGLIVMGQRSDARRRRLVGIYYRRIAWLLLFGLLHAYLLWEGDILFFYALCGFVLFLFRRMRPTTQIVLGLLVFLTALPLDTGLGLLMRRLQQLTGPENNQGTAQLQEVRRQLEEALLESRDIDNDIALHRSGYAAQFRRRAVINLGEETAGFVLWAGPRAGGLMLLGMGLMQQGVFAAARSVRFYVLLVLIGYGLGLPIVGYGIYDAAANQFDLVNQLIIGGHFNYVGSLFVAVGHVGVVMLICKAGMMRGLTIRLAAVGRMALSNYLMQSLICTTLFEGWGFGLYGRLDRFALLGVVASVWLVQLALSPIWLRHFRFGPMEWLWRSLTYWRIYPMRVVGERLA